MSWLHKEREISKDAYYDIEAGKKEMEDYFSQCELVGYSATPLDAYERDGKYYIYYGISTSCD